MDVVAYLTPSLSHSLRVALEPAHGVREANDWRDLSRTVRRSSVGAVVVDPTIDGEAGVAAVDRLARRHPDVPIVVFTTLSAPAMRAVAALSAAGLRDVVLDGCDGSPAYLRAVIERQPGEMLGAAVVERLAPALEALPVGLARVIAQLLVRPGGVVNATELGEAAGLPRRTLYRTCAAAGLASPSDIVRAARLLHAYAHLRDGSQSAGDVVSRLGYSSRQLFWRHVWDTFGMRPTDLRRDLRPDEFVRRLTLAIWPGATRARVAPGRTTDDSADGRA